jgi:uncharacterized membrane protein
VATARLDAPTTVSVTVTAPPGWLLLVDVWWVDLAPGGWGEVDVAVAGRRSATPPGHHAVRVVAEAGGQAGRSYDEHIVTVERTDRALRLSEELASVTITPGGTTTAWVDVTNATTGDRWAELDVLGPWGAWPLVTTSRHAITVAAGATTTVPIEIAAPLDMPVGAWWWLVRAIAGPDVAYSPSAPLAVTPSVQ